MNNLVDVFRSRISKRVLISILLFSSVITLLFTTYKLYQDYLRDIEYIDQQLIIIEEYTSPLLGRAIWHVDESTINTLITSIAQIPYIAHISVNTQDGRTYQAGVLTEPSEPDRKHTLHYHDPIKNNKRTLGELHLYSDYSSVFEELKNRFLVTLYTQLFKTFLTSLFILLLVHHLIGRHLNSIANHLNDTRKQKNKLQLQRQPASDELQLVVDTLNQYSTKITQQNLLNNALFHANDRLVFVVSEKMQIVQSNFCATQNSGYTEAELAGKNIHDVITLQISKKDKHKSHQSECVLIDEMIREQQRSSFQGYCSLGGRELFPASISLFPLYHDDSFLGCAISIRDETSQQLFETISYNATHDYLTGAYNRYHFDEKVEQIIATAKNKKDKVYTVGLLDLDSFKAVNDLLGHHAGDEVLVTVAQLMRQSLGNDQIIARQGGDEFVFLIPASLHETQKRIQNLLQNLENHEFKFGDKTFFIRASVGLSPFSPGLENISLALSKADESCYQIKDNGGGNVQAAQKNHVHKSHEQRLTDYQTINILRKELKEKTPELHIQTLIPLQTTDKLPERHEILIRFFHLEQYLRTDLAVSSLERARLTHLLDTYTIQCLTHYLETTETPLQHFNLNLCPMSLHNAKTQQAAFDILKLCQHKNCTLFFEITENVLINHLEQVKPIIQQLKLHGAKIAIDAFGKGHAPYDHIDSLGIEMIKIDGDLIRKVGKSKKSQAIISSIQSIADSFSALTVAKHVKNTEDKIILREIGIDYTQSFLDSIPKKL